MRSPRPHLLEEVTLRAKAEDSGTPMQRKRPQSLISGILYSDKDKQATRLVSTKWALGKLK